MEIEKVMSFFLVHPIHWFKEEKITSYLQATNARKKIAVWEKLEKYIELGYIEHDPIKGFRFNMTYEMRTILKFIGNTREI